MDSDISMSELMKMSGHCASIERIDESWLEKATARQLTLTKPPGSLGRLKEVGNRLSAIQQTVTPDVTQKRWPD
jgi:nicotinate-nucleotide--dimethylbenzimidazole phosphoribosyltransferase